jgi:hypothetical protein
VIHNAGKDGHEINTQKNMYQHVSAVAKPLVVQSLRNISELSNI